jgi:hypothetical protein
LQAGQADLVARLHESCLKYASGEVSLKTSLVEKNLDEIPSAALKEQFD